VGHSGSTVGRYILIYTRQGRAGRVEGMQRVSCESRGDVKDRHNEIRIRPRKPDGVRVSSARLSRRSGPRARASRPSPPNVGVDRIRFSVRCRIALLAAKMVRCPSPVALTPPCVVRCLAPLVSFARSTYHLTANVSYISFLL
jgi:hypothetical protein